MDIVPDAAVAFGVALAGAPIVLQGLRRTHIVDVPTSRSSHHCPTPRGGGIATALACVLAAAISTDLAGPSRIAILVAAIGLGLIGLIDDIRPSPVLPRLLGQAAVAMTAMFWLLSGVGAGWLFRTLVGAGIVLALVGYANAFNFMDGINGLAVAQVVVAGTTWWILGSLKHVAPLAAAGSIASASALAFAPFNIPRARMFLGDVGSYFLGGWLSVTAVLGLQAGISPEAVLAPLSIFVTDTAITLVTRVRRHEPWAQPHKQHVYQRLVGSGWSHGRTTMVICIIMTSVTALGSLSLTGVMPLRALGDGAGLILLGGYLLLPQLVGTSAMSRSAPASTAG